MKKTLKETFIKTSSGKRKKLYLINPNVAADKNGNKYLLVNNKWIKKMTDIRILYVSGGTLIAFVAIFLLVANLINFGFWLLAPFEFLLELAITLVVTYVVLLILVGVFYGWEFALSIFVLTILPILIILMWVSPIDFDLFGVLGWVLQVIITVGLILAQIYIVLTQGKKVMGELK